MSDTYAPDPPIGWDVMARVGPRLWRIAAVGAGVGAVGSLAAVWPFLFGNEIFQAFIGSSSSVLWGRAVAVGRFVLAAGFPLVGFYSLRLFVQAVPGGPGESGRPFRRVEENLRKMRRILTACMFLALASVVAALMSDPPRWGGGYGRSPVGASFSFKVTGGGAGGGATFPGPWHGLPTAALYGLCCAACGFACRDVRKAVAEFEEADARERGRGFEVEMGPRGAEGLPPLSAITPPAPSTIAPPAPVLAVPVAARAGAASSVPAAGPPPLPPAPLPVASAPFVWPVVRPATAVALPAAAAPRSALLFPADGQGERDLRTLVHVVAVLGICLYVVQAPAFLTELQRYWGYVTNPAAFPTPWSPAGAAAGRLSNTGVPPAFNQSPVAFTAYTGVRVVLDLSKVAWVVWGVRCVSAGLRTYRPALVLSYITLAAAGLSAGVGVYLLIAAAPGYYANVVGISPYDASFQVVGRSAILSNLALNLAHPVLLLALLTRPRVRDLFARGSEAAEHH